MGYPYLIGLHYNGVYIRYPYPSFCLCFYFGGPSSTGLTGLRVSAKAFAEVALHLLLVAEWIHFALLGIILPTIKLKVYTLGGL